MTKFIKLFMVAIFAALAGSLISCGNDDDEDAPTSRHSLVGTWNGASVEYDDETMTITFHKDGKVELVKYIDGDLDVKSTGTYVASQSTISFNLESTWGDDDSFKETYVVPYVLSEDVLMIGETDNTPFQEDYRFTRTK